MKKDYFIIISDKNRGASFSENRFVMRAKNALVAERETLEILKGLPDYKEKEWVIWDIRRI